jgi:hypothetical protein
MFGRFASGVIGFSLGVGRLLEQFVFTKTQSIGIEAILALLHCLKAMKRFYKGSDHCRRFGRQCDGVLKSGSVKSGV